MLAFDFATLRSGRTERVATGSEEVYQSSVVRFSYVNVPSRRAREFAARSSSRVLASRCGPPARSLFSWSACAVQDLRLQTRS